MLTNLSRVLLREQVAEIGDKTPTGLTGGTQPRPRLFSAPQSLAGVTMAGLGQILHVGKEHVYTKHLQRMRDGMLVLEPSQQAGRAPHGKDKRPLTSAPRETNTQEVKLIFPKTEARGSLESPDASFSQVSLESLPQRAFPVSPHCCWDPSRLPLQLVMGHRYRGTILSSPPNWASAGLWPVL